MTLYPPTRGLTTGPMLHGERYVEIAFDFLDHRLEVRASDGRQDGFDLLHRPACADFYAQTLGLLSSLGTTVDIDPQPFDLGDSPAFPEDE